MSRPRALLLSPDFPPNRGGIELVMERLAGGLRELEVHVVTLGSEGDRAFDAAQPYRVRRVALQRRRNRLAVARLNAAGLADALRARPDVLISGHAVTGPAARAVRRLTGRPALQYVHAEEFRDRPRLSAFAVRGVDAVVAVSRYSAELAVAAGAPSERVHRIAPGVELPAAPPAGAKADRPTLITVSRLRDREKGHGELIRALPEIRRLVPEVEWVVIGDGPLRPELEALAARAGVSEAVRFLGAVSDAERDAWLARAHVFVLPNHAGEGFGIVFLEAAACGLPVVAGAVGGALDAVADGETGVLVDASDPGALAAATSALLLDPERAARMGRAGARRAAGFTWPAHVTAVERLALDLVRHARAPRGRR